MGGAVAVEVGVHAEGVGGGDGRVQNYCENANERQLDTELVETT